MTHGETTQRWADIPLVDNDACSVARAVDIIGDRWSVLVLREVFLGVRRFDVMQRHLGIARNVLTDRLNRLVDAGILTRVPYSDRPPRSEYRLTEAGIDLWPTIVAFMQWGRKHLPTEQEGIWLEHKGCGERTTFSLVCDQCGEQVTARDTRAAIDPEIVGKRAAASAVRQ